MTNGVYCDLTKLLGRVLMSLMFITAGWNKIGGYAGTQSYMESAGVPGLLLPLVILVELGGGLAILLGLFTRWAALALALFCLASAVLFHYVPDDQGQMISFMKNITIAGGFFILACAGAGRLSLDHKIRGK
ncbi:DoxX family protein [Microbulbifer taiwanensis]|uniref:DoxX family protein n=1 Tax=Microbulbifer taiwanensis TaxID=986746 RepID=A0ABW1YM53_9GAMM|nr:DoxX family protein [Microbulbifer taiwanensis]